MPLPWRTRAKGRGSENSTKDKDKEIRRRSLRYIFKSSDVRERELLQAGSSSSQEQDTIPRDSEVAATLLHTPELATPTPIPSEQDESRAEEVKSSAGDNDDVKDQLVEEGETEQPNYEDPSKEKEPEGEDHIGSLFTGASQPSSPEQAGMLSPSPPGASAKDGGRTLKFILPSHESYMSATSSKPTTEDVASHGEDGKAFETPSMLTAHGPQRGTVTLAYFLQIPHADDRLPDANVEQSEQDPEIRRNLELLATDPEKLGLRKMDVQAIVDRLAELSEFAQDLRKTRKRRSLWEWQFSTKQLGASLFDKFLVLGDETYKNPDAKEDTICQVEALDSVLAVRGIWQDFTQVESRIMLGQTLFEDQALILDDEIAEADRRPSARSILLLQILLACELSLRIDHLTKESQSSQRMVKVNQARSNKVQWDLMLSRIFLENVRVVTQSRQLVKLSTVQRARRYFFPASFDTPREPELVEEPDVALFPRYQEKQLDGLRHFAREIGWSEMDDMEATLAAKFPPLPSKRKSLADLRSSSIYATPAASKPQETDQEGDYFGNAPPPTLKRQSTKPILRPQFSRGRTIQRSFTLQPSSPVATPLSKPGGHATPATQEHQPTGWLTRAYLTGLILPGEILQHHLVSAMLENSPEAMSNLGDTATLYGGFVYHRRSYWSRQCVVGRVLACMKSSQEGWGWVGTKCNPGMRWPWGGDGGWRGVGWIDITVQDPPGISAAKARKLEDIEHESHMLAGSSIDAVTTSNFTLPLDAPKHPATLLWFDGLQLERHAGDAPALKGLDPEEPAPPATCKASLAFSSASMSDMGNPRVPLTFDVFFISAIPCNPPSVDRLARVRSTFEKGPGETHEPELKPVHPLHTSHRYRIASAAGVLKKDFVHDLSSKEVLVLDARGSETLELLARAWCASKGQHAVIGNQTDTCLACCVREARAAGVSVVIRVV